MREALPPPVRLVDEGRAQFGTYAGPIAATNLIDAQPWALPAPRFVRSLRLKEWQAFQFGNARWFFAVALFDAKTMALAQFKIYDRERRQKYLFERKLPSWALRAPANLLDSHMHWSGGGAAIRFDNHLAQGHIDIHIELPAEGERPAVHAQLRALAAECEPEVVCIPFGERRGMYSHKGCLALEGEVRLGAETIALSPADSYLLMDDHKGYYGYVMRWDWVTGGGFDEAGRRIGFNLTRNASIDPEAYNENCVWIGGKRHLLGPVVFTRRPDRNPEIWEVRDAAGRGEVEVDFEIEVDGHVRVNALVIESRYRGPFGRVHGQIRPPGVEPVTLDGMFGMGEDFYLRC